MCIVALALPVLNISRPLSYALHQIPGLQKPSTSGEGISGPARGVAYGNKKAGIQPALSHRCRTYQYRVAAGPPQPKR